MPLSVAGGIPVGIPGACQFTYKDLQDKYVDFAHPRAQVLLGDTPFDSVSTKMAVNDIHVEVTSGYEASVASFRLYDSYDPSTGKFFYEKVKKQVLMGNSVTVQLGYLDKLETVFVGFVSGVAFGFEPGGLPYIEINAMDIKGLMMGGSYATSLRATTYSAAVKEVLDRTGEGRLQQMKGITSSEIINTPDAGGATGVPGGAPTGGSSKSSPITMEMVSESDYEFVVRAAQRYNYEFFVDRGKVLFPPAKSDTSLLTKMGTRTGLRGFHIQYSITGVVGKIEARAMDPGKGEVITAKSSFNNTISTASKAKQLVGKGAKVYLDASITSKEEAEARVASLMEQMSYRLGSLEADCVGIPDLVPGRFIEVTGMGVPVDNQFYLTAVTHDFTSDGGYRTHIEGCAAQIKTSSASEAAGAAAGAAAAAGSAAGAAGAAAGAASTATEAAGAVGDAAAGAASTAATAAGIAALVGMGAATAAPLAAGIVGMAGGFGQDDQDGQQSQEGQEGQEE